MGFNEALRGNAYKQPFKEDPFLVDVDKELAEMVYENPKPGEPFGTTSSLTTVVFGDLHIPRAETKDDPLFGAGLLNKFYFLTKHSSNIFHPSSSKKHPDIPAYYETTDWYKTVKQERFMHASLAWSGAFRDHLYKNSELFSRDNPNALFLNLGDIAGDSAQEGDLHYAAYVHNEIYKELREILLGHYVRGERLTPDETQILYIQLLGDHDYESTRARRDQAQIGWAHKKFGVNGNFIQHIGTENAMIGVTTNLLHRRWQKNIADIADQSLHRINQKTDHRWRILHPETVEEVQAYVTNNLDDPELTSLLLPLIYYQEVYRRTQQQEVVIQEAKEMEHIVIAGHDPGIVRKLAIDMQVPHTTTFSGHRHIASGSEVEKQIITLSKGKKMALQPLVLGAPTADYLGYRIHENPPMGYIFRFSASEHFPEIQSLSLADSMGKIEEAKWYI